MTSPAALLDGPPNLSLSPKEASALAAVENAKTGLAHWAAQVKLYSRAGIAAMAMGGIHLRALREHFYGPRNPMGGRPRKRNTLPGCESWKSMLADIAGITDQTATRWMKIADVVESMAAQEGGDVITICQKLPWEWTPEESEKLSNTITKLTEDKTQRELLQSDFLASLGYTAPERVNASNNPTGKNGGKKKPAATPAALAKERQEAARMYLSGSPERGKIEHGSVRSRMNLLCASGGKEIEAMPQAEMRHFYEHTVKPFADLVRKLAGL